MVEQRGAGGLDLGVVMINALELASTGFRARGLRDVATFTGVSIAAAGFLRGFRAGFGASEISIAAAASGVSY